ncbi:hypothetical protein TNCV_4919311 [Trichonephila clavipes]|nr:hypothetical protein TNCV_4919311 [Trichonephila clavipes]
MMPAPTMILHVGYRSFSWIFLDDKQYHSRARSIGVYNPMTDKTYSRLRIVRMPSPVQSIVMLTTPLQTGSMVLSGQWDTHNRSACV